MSLLKPTPDLLTNPSQFQRLLQGYYDALTDLVRSKLTFKPARATITLANYAAARQVQGDSAGSTGPLLIIVASKATLGDSGQGVFYWSPTSTAPDDNSTVLQVQGVATGRWLKVAV